MYWPSRLLINDFVDPGKFRKHRHRGVHQRDMLTTCVFNVLSRSQAQWAALIGVSRRGWSRNGFGR
ncbi:hypothetical protein MY3296_007112 [Beauveria thailandica]